MRVVLLLLDTQPPVDEELSEDLARYLGALLQVQVEVAEVPEMPTAPKGWQSLAERLRRDLNSRPGRAGPGAARQLSVPHLMQCMALLRKEPAKYGVPALADAEYVMGLTAGEFYSSTEGLLPDESVPESRTRTAAITTAASPGLGACSVARLDGLGELKGPGRRKFVRQLLTLVSHSLLGLMELRSCHSQQCLAYTKPFSIGGTSHFLCAECENTLMQRNCTDCGSLDALVLRAADRYRDLADVLDALGRRLDPIRFGRRSYVEFEEEIDWLRVGEEILRESGAERKPAHPGKSESRRRSLLSCLRCAHEGQPHRMLNKRTFSEPLLKRTCLVDMTMAAPYRHETGDLTKWTMAVTNRKHTAGGHYVELGGSLSLKRIGTFVDSGVGASMAPSGQERWAGTMEFFAKTTRRNLHVHPPPALPAMRNRVRACIHH